MSGREILEDPVFHYLPENIVATVRGRLLDPDGAPVPGFVLQLRDHHGPPARTAADGSFVCELCATDLGGLGQLGAATTLDVGVPGCEPYRSQVLQLLPGDLDLGDVLLRRAAVLAGRCLDEEDRPLAGVYVQVGRVVREDLDEHGWPFDPLSWSADWAGRGHAVTDASGSFTLPDLPPGLIELSFDHALFRNARLDAVPLHAGGCSLGDVRLTAGLAISGRVLDADGRPAPHVGLFGRSESGWERFQRGGLLHSARVTLGGETDDEGRFAMGGLAAGDFTVCVRPDWATTDSQSFGPFAAGATGLELRLKTRLPEPGAQATLVSDKPRPHPHWTLSGKVIDANGSPLASAEVSVHGSEAVTGEDGAFVLRYVYESEHHLSVWRQGQMHLCTWPFRLDHDMAGLIVQMSPPGALHAQVLVEPGCNPCPIVVELTAVGPLGATSVERADGPALRARFFLEPERPEWVVETRHPNADGSIDWPQLVPGEYELHARAVSEQFLRWGQRDAGGEQEALVVQRVVVLPGQATNVTIPMPASGQLRGVVTVNGLPAEGAVVAAVVGGAWGNERLGETHTSAAGEWQLDGLPPAHYRLVVHAPHIYIPIIFETDVAAGQRPGPAVDLEARFVGHPIEGRVVTTIDGQPVAGAEVCLAPTRSGHCGCGNPSSMDWRRLGGEYGEPVLTDELGRFRFDVVPDGTYEVVASAAGLQSQHAGLVRLPWSEDSPRGIMTFGGAMTFDDPLRLTLRVEPTPPPRIVRGHVSWADGTTPFVSARVSIEANGASVDCHEWPQPPGQFEIWLDRPGDYTLVVRDSACESHEVLRRAVSIRDGETIDLALVAP